MKRSKSDQKIEKSNKIRKEVWSGPNFYLIRKILIQLEKSDKKWQAGQIGNLGIVIQQTDYDTAGKTELLEEAEGCRKCCDSLFALWLIGCLGHNAFPAQKTANAAGQRPDRW